MRLIIPEMWNREPFGIKLVNMVIIIINHGWFNRTDSSILPLLPNVEKKGTNVKPKSIQNLLGAETMMTQMRIPQLIDII